MPKYAIQEVSDGFVVTRAGAALTVEDVRKTLPLAVLIMNNVRDRIVTFPRYQYAAELVMKLEGEN